MPKYYFHGYLLALGTKHFNLQSLNFTQCI